MEVQREEYSKVKTHHENAHDSLMGWIVCGGRQSRSNKKRENARRIIGGKMRADRCAVLIIKLAAALVQSKSGNLIRGKNTNFSRVSSETYFPTPLIIVASLFKCSFNSVWCHKYLWFVDIQSNWIWAEYIPDRENQYTPSTFLRMQSITESLETH